MTVEESAVGVTIAEERRDRQQPITAQPVGPVHTESSSRNLESL